MGDPDFDPADVLSAEDGDLFWIPRVEGIELTAGIAVERIRSYLSQFLDAYALDEQTPRLDELGISEVWFRLNPDEQQVEEDGLTHVRCEPTDDGAIAFWQVTA